MSKTAMSEYTLQDGELRNVRGRTLLITGAANGTGHATVKPAHGMQFA